MMWLGYLLPLANNVASENANSDTYQTQTIHGKYDMPGTHTHTYTHTLTCAASLHLFQSQ